jgi:hypothetical protein
MGQSINLRTDEACGFTPPFAVVNPTHVEQGREKFYWKESEYVDPGWYKKASKTNGETYDPAL